MTSGLLKGLLALTSESPGSCLRASRSVPRTEGFHTMWRSRLKRLLGAQLFTARMWLLNTWVSRQIGCSCPLVREVGQGRGSPPACSFAAASLRGPCSVPLHPGIAAHRSASGTAFLGCESEGGTLLAASRQLLCVWLQVLVTRRGPTPVRWSQVLAMIRQQWARLDEGMQRLLDAGERNEGRGCWLGRSQQTLSSGTAAPKLVSRTAGGQTEWQGIITPR